jgi:hypothetical protein
MNRFTDNEYNLILNELCSYLPRNDVLNLSKIGKLTSELLKSKVYEVQNLSLSDSSVEEYSARLDYLLDQAKLFINIIEIENYWDKAWTSKYLKNFRKLESLTLKNIKIDVEELNLLEKVKVLRLIDVDLTNADKFKLRVDTLEVVGNSLGLLEYLPCNQFTQLIVKNTATASNAGVLSTNSQNTIIVGISTHSYLTQPLVNILFNLANQPIQTVQTFSLNLEITKLTEILSIWSTLQTLQITHAILFPPSRIVRTLPNISPSLQNIDFNTVDFRGYNYLNFLIQQNNTTLNLTNSILDKFNSSQVNYTLVN